MKKNMAANLAMGSQRLIGPAVAIAPGATSPDTAITGTTLAVPQHQVKQ
jgi:hypothetical protein